GVLGRRTDPPATERLGGTRGASSRARMSSAHWLRQARSGQRAPRSRSAPGPGSGPPCASRAALPAEAHPAPLVSFSKISGTTLPAAFVLLVLFILAALGRRRWWCGRRRWRYWHAARDTRVGHRPLALLFEADSLARPMPATKLVLAMCAG